MCNYFPRLALQGLLCTTFFGCRDATRDVDLRRSSRRPANALTIEPVQAQLDLTSADISEASLAHAMAGPQIELNSLDAKDGKVIDENEGTFAETFSIYTGPRIIITATVARLDPGIMPTNKFNAGTLPSAYLVTKPTITIPGHPNCHFIKLFYFSTGNSFFDYMIPGNVLYVVFSPDSSLISVSPARLFPKPQSQFIPPSQNKLTQILILNHPREAVPSHTRP